jgi:hypothetical protein
METSSRPVREPSRSMKNVVLTKLQRQTLRYPSRVQVHVHQEASYILRSLRAVCPAHNTLWESVAADLVSLGKQRFNGELSCDYVEPPSTLRYDRIETGALVVNQYAVEGKTPVVRKVE